MRPQSIGTSRFPDKLDLSKSTTGKDDASETSFAELFQYVAEGVQGGASPKGFHANGRPEQDASQGMPGDEVKPELPSPQTASALPAGKQVALPVPAAAIVPEESSPIKTPIELAEMQVQGEPSVRQDAEDAISLPAVELESADSAKQEAKTRKPFEPSKERDIELQVTKPTEKQVSTSVLAGSIDHHVSPMFPHHHIAAPHDQKMQNIPAADEASQNSLSVAIAQPQIASTQTEEKPISVKAEIATASVRAPRKVVSQQLASQVQTPQAEMQATPAEEGKAAPVVVEEKGAGSASTAHGPTALSGSALTPAVSQASLMETVSALSAFQGTHSMEAKPVQAAEFIERPHAEASYFPASADGSLPHVELASSDRSLEIGVVHEIHGWLKIRAELTGNGEVSASLTGSSSSADRLRSDLPALNSYLREERVPLADLSVHAALMLSVSSDTLHSANAAHMMDGMSSDTAGQAHANAQDRQQQQRQGMQTPVAQSSSDESRDTIFATRSAADLHEEHRALGWISVRA